MLYWSNGTARAAGLWEYNGTAWVQIGAGSFTGNVSITGTLSITGLLTPSSGILGQTTGTAIAAGNIGQILTISFSNTSATSPNTPYQVGSTYSLPAGVWMIYGTGVFATGAAGNTAAIFDINTSVAVRAGPYYYDVSSTSGTVGVQAAITPLYINSATATNIYGVGSYNYTSSGSSSSIIISAFAIRIA